MTPPANILETIMTERRHAVAAQERSVPLQALKDRAQGRTHHSLISTLQTPGTHIIAEIKKASPSAGTLRPDYQPTRIAQDYESAGAAGISILTEPKHFQGSSEHLEAVRAALPLPILRKDFTCVPYHLYEAAAWGADVILLIVAGLDPSELIDLAAEAQTLGLDVLVEAHTEDECELALSCPDCIVGINSRNLKTLKTDLAVAETLASAIPSDRLSIAESGIKTREDVIRLQAKGYKGFLIGESLLRHDSPGTALKTLLGESA